MLVALVLLSLGSAARVPVHEVLSVAGTCVIGLQWGDEAKGKIVDRLTKEHDFVVRYQGGANAGHTVVVGERESTSSRCCPAAFSRRA